jgi:DNA-binding response OmpR family regulator
MSVEILIIDDEPVCLESISLILQMKKFSPRTAENGEEGIAKAEQYADSIKLILLDFMLPDMSGEEVLKKLKENSKTANIPVIIQTGALDQNIRSNEVIKNNAAAYLSKPYKTAALMQLIETVLKEHA